jgi:hypothetical protein
VSSTSLALQSEEARPAVIQALRGLKGRGTLGDVVAATGLPRDQAEATLKGLLETLKGQLEVSDSGELVYLFDKRLTRRDAVPLLDRIRATASRVLKRAFKAWIVLMLVVYFVVFVALVVAAIVAMLSRGNDRRGGGWGGGRRGHHGHFSIFDFWLMSYLWGPRWRVGRPYYGRRWERTLDKDDRVPFYKKVFAFVFGPDRPEPSLHQRDRTKLRLIRARKGVLTTAELVEHTALPLPEAEEEMGRLVGSYEGEPMVTGTGELVYAFPELMLSAHGPVKAREPNPAWQRMEYPLELTGNEKKTDALIIGINGFNLLAGVTAPWFIFPQLGIGGTAAFVGLVIIPVIFSMLFFTVPMLRSVQVRSENRKRARRNTRRALLAMVYQDALGSSSRGLTVEQAVRGVQARLDGQGIEAADVEEVLQDLASEFDADVVVGPNESIVYRFPQVRRQFEASELTRRRLQLEKAELGETVYSSADTPEEAAARDLAAFDRELAKAKEEREALEAGEELNLERYLPSPERIGYEDDFELVAIDDTAIRAGSRR